MAKIEHTSIGSVKLLLLVHLLTACVLFSGRNGEARRLVSAELSSSSSSSSSSTLSFGQSSSAEDSSSGVSMDSQSNYHQNSDHSQSSSSLLAPSSRTSFDGASSSSIGSNSQYHHPPGISSMSSSTGSTSSTRGGQGGHQSSFSSPRLISSPGSQWQSSTLSTGSFTAQGTSSSSGGSSSSGSSKGSSRSSSSESEVESLPIPPTPNPNEGHDCTIKQCCYQVDWRRKVVACFQILVDISNSESVSVQVFLKDWPFADDKFTITTERPVNETSASSCNVLYSTDDKLCIDVAFTQDQQAVSAVWHSHTYKGSIPPTPVLISVVSLPPPPEDTDRLRWPMVLAIILGACVTLGMMVAVTVVARRRSQEADLRKLRASSHGSGSGGSTPNSLSLQQVMLGTNASDGNSTDAEREQPSGGRGVNDRERESEEASSPGRKPKRSYGQRDAMDFRLDPGAQDKQMSKGSSGRSRSKERSSGGARGGSSKSSKNRGRSFSNMGDEHPSQHELKEVVSSSGESRGRSQSPAAGGGAKKTTLSIADIVLAATRANKMKDQLHHPHDENGDTVPSALDEASDDRSARSQTTKASEETKKISQLTGMEREEARARIVEFYKKYCPERIGKVDIALQFDGTEEELMTTLKGKYQVVSDQEEVKDSAATTETKNPLYSPERSQRPSSPSSKANADTAVTPPPPAAAVKSNDPQHNGGGRALSSPSSNGLSNSTSCTPAPLPTASSPRARKDTTTSSASHHSHDDQPSNSSLATKEGSIVINMHEI